MRGVFLFCFGVVLFVWFGVCFLNFFKNYNLSWKHVFFQRARKLKEPCAFLNSWYIARSVFLDLYFGDYWEKERRRRRWQRRKVITLNTLPSFEIFLFIPFVPTFSYFTPLFSSRSTKFYRDNTCSNFCESCWGNHFRLQTFWCGFVQLIAGLSNQTTTTTGKQLEAYISDLISDL